MREEFHIIKVPGDGNCCFHFITAGLNLQNPDDLTHKRLRKDEAQFVCNNFYFSLEFFPDHHCVEEHLRHNRQPNCSVDSDVISATATMLNCSISVFGYHEKPHCFDLKIKYVWKPRNAYDLRTEPGHFDALVKIPTRTVV